MRVTKRDEFLEENDGLEQNEVGEMDARVRI